MDRQELASLDVLGSDEELRAAARAERPAPGPDADVDAEGRDASRTVAVRVDRRGHVSDVLISAWWRDDLTPAELPEAVLTAYRAALARATAHLAPDDPAGASPADAEAAPEDYDGDDHGWFLDVRRRLDRTEEALVRSGERLTRPSDAERVVSGPDGLVRLVLTGTVVSEVQIDVRAALRESSNRLAADALAAFQAIN
jgi:hypothetical protein